MQFNRVVIENFGTIGKVVLELQNRGLVLVTGLNKDTPKADSNGAGKSLLLDAFCWGIWGRTVREDSGDDVVNDRIGKDCMVSVDFEERGKKFEIIRYRKHTQSKKPNDLELFLNGTDLSGASTKATQDVVNGIMGLTFETFCALMPGAGKNAAQMTDSDIKELLENMLQITALARARLVTKKRLDKLLPEIAKLDGEVGALDTQISRDMKRCDDYAAEGQVYAVRHQEKAKALGQAAEKAVEAVWRTSKLVDDGETASSEISRIAAKRTALSDRNRVDWDAIQAVERKVTLVRKELSSKRSEAKGELKVREAALDKAMRLGVTCFNCQQDICTEHAEKVQGAAEDLVSRLQEKLENLDKLYSECYDEEMAERAPYQAAMDKNDAAIEVHNASIRLLNPALETARTAAAQLPGLKKAVLDAEARARDLGAEKSPYEAWILQTQDQIEAAAQDRAEKQFKLSQKLTLETQLNFWKKAFSPSGIRSFILDNVTPVLNESAKHYCELLTEGEMSVDFSTKTVLKNGETREKFSINIKQKHGGKSYKSNSRGERQRANLVTAFALSDLAELHSSKRVDFRFLDEPFEGIDESGAEAVVSLLQEQQERYPTVFVVTHQSHFKDVFPSEIQMIKEGGMSRLEG